MQKILLALILFTALMSPIVPAWGAAFVPKEFAQLVTEAEQIFIGTVLGMQSRKVPAGAILTDITFTNLQVLKGGTGADQIVLTILGGTVGNQTFKLTGLPEFQTGVRYLVFSKGNGTTIFPVVGGEQGLFQVKYDSTSGQELVFDAYGKPISSSKIRDAILGSDPTASNAADPISLNRFLQAIETGLGR